MPTLWRGNKSQISFLATEQTFSRLTDYYRLDDDFIIDHSMDIKSYHKALAAQCKKALNECFVRDIEPGYE